MKRAKVISKKFSIYNRPGVINGKTRWGDRDALKFYLDGADPTKHDYTVVFPEEIEYLDCENNYEIY